MISGGCGGVGIVTFEKIHSSSHGFRKPNVLFWNPRSLSAQCSVADDRHRELLSPRLPRDTVQSALDHTYVLEHQYLSLKKEGGVQKWTRRDFSTSTDVLGSRQRPVSNIAEAAIASEKTGSAQGEQVGIPDSIEGNAIVGDGEGFKWDPVEGIKDLAKQAEILREEVMSLDYRVSPTPFTPVEGAEAFKFAVICVFLLFIFWLGNYYVPDLIFKDTVFRKEPEDPLDPTGTTSGDDNVIVSNQKSQKVSSEASKTSEGDGQNSAIKSGAGFSRNIRQNRSKSAKRK